MGSPAPHPPTDPAAGWLTEIRSALSGEQRDYTSGSLMRAVVLLAIPMVLEMAMESVFAVCDIFFVAHLGEDAIATVGLTEAMLTIVYALGIGLAMGTTALVARRIGEKDPERASHAGAQAVYLGIAVGVAIGVPAWIFGADLLRAMGASATLVETGSSYTSILLGSNVVIVLLFVDNAVFRGAGDAVIAMRALWIANAINLVLDPCLIFGLGPFPELGLTGAAIATACGRGVGVLYQLRALRAGVGRIRLRGAQCTFDIGVTLHLVRVSLGGVGQFLIATASWVVLMRIVAPFGPAALAGYTIAIRVLIFAFLPAWGLSNAAATLVGQNLGAGQPDRAERSVWLTGALNMAFLAVVTVVCVALAEPLVGIFTDDGPAIDTGGKALRIISYGYVFYAWGLVLVQAFNGAGDTGTPTRLNFVCFWLLQIPLALSLARAADWGPPGVFWSVAISESILAVLALLLFRRGRWKLKRV